MNSSISDIEPSLLMKYNEICSKDNSFAMHRVSEAVRNHHNFFDQFIENMRKLLTNSPKRKEECQNFCNLSLPKHPVITRWCTWLEVADFYIENFEIIRKFIEKIGYKESQILSELKKLVENPELVDEMIELKLFQPSILKVKKIQSNELSAKDQIKVITELK